MEEKMGQLLGRLARKEKRIAALPQTDIFDNERTGAVEGDIVLDHRWLGKKCGIAENASAELTDG